MCARRPTHGVRHRTRASLLAHARGRGAIALLAVLLGTACASAGQSWRAGPAGIPAEREIRRTLAAEQYDAAWQLLKQKKIAPADALLRHLYKGVVAMHAGELDEGVRSMDRAWSIVYDRWTKRLSDQGQALLTGDGALPYYPGPAEQMFIPYYGGLTWLARNDRDAAAVEARRLSTLLASDQGPQPPREFQGVMRYVAGVMYEVAGERNDADVSYRNALELLGAALPGDTTAPDAGHGDVVVLIEDGFVDRPEPNSLLFWYRKDELDALDSDDDDRRSAAVSRMGARRYEQRDWAADDYRSVSIRWPTMEPSLFVRSTEPLGARALGAAPDAEPDAASVAVPVVTPVAMPASTITMSVSDAVRADFDRRQPARLARAVARSVVRDLSLKGAGAAFEKAGDIASSDDDKKKDDEPVKSKSGDDKKGDDEGGKGWKIAGAILLGIGLLAVHAGSQVLDQPDLRAWQLLPDRVTIARVRLPVGEFPIEVTRGGEAFSLGTVTVRPGSVTVLTHRWWPEGGRPAGAARPDATP